MPGAFLERDLPGLMRLDEFATTAMVVTGDAMGDVVRGIYTAPYSDAFGVAGALPEFVIATCDRGDLSNGDVIEIDGRQYRARSNEPDSTGITRFELNEV